MKKRDLVGKPTARERIQEDIEEKKIHKPGKMFIQWLQSSTGDHIKRERE